MSEQPGQSPAFAWPGAAGVLAALLALLNLSWRRSAHFLVDFGRELYVPWRIVEGDALYRDLAYFNGPLSPWFNATLFRLFGVSVTTLLVVNTLLLIAVTSLLYFALGRLGNRLARFSGCLLFLVVFALSDIYQFGNYNFITPYSHEMTHGFLLALVTLFLLGRYLDEPRGAWLVGIGLGLGLTFLTKAEIFMATAGAVAVGLALDAWRRRQSAMDLAANVGKLAVGACLPPVLAFGALCLDMPASESLRGVLGSWAHLFRPELKELHFYKLYMGTLDLADSLLQIAAWTLFYLVAFLPVILIARKVSPLRDHRFRLVAAGAAWVFLLTFMALNTLNPDDLIRPLPVLLLATAALNLRRDPTTRQLLWVTASVFAFLLLFKIFFFTRFHHYGFVLAVPGFLVLVLTALSAIPDWIDARGGYGRMLQIAALVFFTMISIDVLRISAIGYRRNDVELGTGGDRLIVAEKGRLIAEAVDWLQANTSRAETLAVFPEGAMLNYQTRRANSTPYFTLLPPEMIMFGEPAILEAYRSHPPDVIVVIKRSTRVYGYTAFGEGYAEDLDQWLRDHYQVVHSIVEPDFEPDFSRLFVFRRQR